MRGQASQRMHSRRKRQQQQQAMMPARFSRWPYRPSPASHGLQHLGRSGKVSCMHDGIGAPMCVRTWHGSYVLVQSYVKGGMVWYGWKGMGWYGTVWYRRACDTDGAIARADGMEGQAARLTAQAALTSPTDALCLADVLQGFGSGIKLPKTREEFRAEIFTPPDLKNLGVKGRPAVQFVATWPPPIVPNITMGRWVKWKPATCRPAVVPSCALLLVIDPGRTRVVHRWAILRRISECIRQHVSHAANVVDSEHRFHHNPPNTHSPATAPSGPVWL